MIDGGIIGGFRNIFQRRTRAKTVCVVCLLYFLLRCSYCSAATFSVPNQFNTIQAALNASSNGDIVTVAPGTYTQNLDFQNKSVALRSSAGPASTIIHVQGGVAVNISGTAELNGFTITGAMSDF